MAQLHLNKKELTQMIVEQILKCYDENGNTIQNYSNNIDLPDLTLTELKRLKEIAK